MNTPFFFVKFVPLSIYFLEGEGADFFHDRLYQRSSNSNVRELVLQQEPPTTLLPELGIQMLTKKMMKYKPFFSKQN